MSHPFHACGFVGLVARAFVLIGCVSATPVAQTPQEVLDNYARFLSSIPQWDIQATTEQEVTGVVLNENYSRKSTYTYAYRRRGDDYDIERVMNRFNSDGEATLSNQRRHVLTFGDSVFSRSGYGGEYLPFFQRRQRGQMTTAHDGVNLDGGEALDGFLARDGIGVVEILRGAETLSLRPHTEFIQDTECFVLEGMSPDRGQYTLWLAPSFGWASLRAVVRKTGNDFYFDKSLAESYPPPAPGVTLAGTNFPSDVLAEVNYEVDNVTFSRIDAVQIPVSCTVTQTHVYPNGESTTFSNTHRRTRIDLDPDFASMSAFERAIPNGAEVRDPNMPGIRLTMRDGKIGPSVDTEVIASIEAGIAQVQGELDYAAAGELTVEESALDRRDTRDLITRSRLVVMSMAVVVAICSILAIARYGKARAPRIDGGG